MMTSNNGRNLIKSFESLRLKAYNDGTGVYTIGWGHTGGIKKGMEITKVQAESYFNQDLVKAEKAVNKYQNRYNFNQNEYDAMVSFAFNIGSITQLTALGTRSKAQIADKMLLYCKAGKKQLAGLVNRRFKECQLFLTPVSSVICMGIDYSKVFDPIYYLARYSDVQKVVGNDHKAAFQHFLVYGMNEKRQGIATFNVEVYASNNPDVVKASYKNGQIDYPTIYRHYCEFGYKENRKAY